MVQLRTTIPASHERRPILLSHSYRSAHAVLYTSHTPRRQSCACNNFAWQVAFSTSIYVAQNRQDRRRTRPLSSTGSRRNHPNIASKIVFGFSYPLVTRFKSKPGSNGEQTVKGSASWTWRKLRLCAGLGLWKVRVYRQLRKNEPRFSWQTQSHTNAK